MRKEKLKEINSLIKELKCSSVVRCYGEPNFLKSEVYDSNLNGNVFKREKLVKNNLSGDAIVIFPVTSDNNVLLVAEPRVFTKELVGIGVPKYVDIINRKIEKENLDMNAMTSDALHLPFDDDEFDVVLLSGPIYHLPLLEDKNQAISEASRVCKNDGTVVVDYLPKIHGFIQHVLLSNEFLKGMNNEEIEKYDCKDDMFSYDDSATIKDVMNKNYISNVKVYGTDSITRFIKEEINLLKDEDLSKWVVFVKSISDNPGVVVLSEHALAIGKKDRVLKR